MKDRRRWLSSVPPPVSNDKDVSVGDAAIAATAAGEIGGGGQRRSSL